MWLVFDLNNLVVHEDPDILELFHIVKLQKMVLDIVNNLTQYITYNINRIWLTWIIDYSQQIMEEDPRLLSWLVNQTHANACVISKKDPS